MAKPRLFVEHPLVSGHKLVLNGDAHHYLVRVMRLREGNFVELFNGKSDAFNAEVNAVHKDKIELTICDVSAKFRMPPDLALAFAPIKKARTDFIVEKAAELGVCSIHPMQTEFTNSERIRVDRLQRHAVEAVEQCGGTFIPQVFDLVTLKKLLEARQDRQLLFCDEAVDNGTGHDHFMNTKSKKWMILIGPEGGFSKVERNLIQSYGALTLSLGPRILRADTAAVAAITLWQKTHGDWQ